MTDPKRLVILKALTAHLAAINPGNGFQHDLTGRVFRGRSGFSSETPLPCLSILEAYNPDRSPLDAGAGLSQKDQWVLLVSGWTDYDGDDTLGQEPSVDAAHRLMADVKKALGSILDPGPTPHNPNPSYMLGDVIEGLRVEPGTVRPPDETSNRSYFYLRIVVEVAERLDDPYMV